MKTLAELGEIPKRLAKVVPPKCAGCIFGAMTKVAWKGKEDQRHIFIATKPGECVSVDQMISTQVGFIAQLKGKLTRDRYKAATIFVDHYSRLRFVHLMRDLTSEETINAKLAFEQYARDHGVTIKHYHADNGLFRTKPFEQDIEKKGQTLTFAGVGAHHQNGIAEKRIGDLQRRATTLLLLAQRRWPDAINTHLWPYAIRCANETRNTCPTKTSALSPLNRFCQSDRKPSYRHQHHFGCPVYVLNKDIQDGKKARKWIDRTRIGINLGPSPRHASSVALILNLKTGLVSPQFHCQYDDLFESTTGTQARHMPQSLWQQKCGFSLNHSSEDEGDTASRSEPTEVTTNITH